MVGSGRLEVSVGPATAGFVHGIGRSSDRSGNMARHFDHTAAGNGIWRQLRDPGPETRDSGPGTGRRVDGPGHRAPGARIRVEERQGIGQSASTRELA